MIIYLTDFDWDSQCCCCGKVTNADKYIGNSWIHTFVKSPERIENFILCRECYNYIFNNHDEVWRRIVIKEMLHKTTGLEKL